MFGFLRLSSGIVILGQFLIPPSTATYPLLVTEVPTFVRPYVLPYLTEPGVQLNDDIIRLPVTTNSSGGAFSLFRLNGQVNRAVPTHYHSRFYESFFTIKGRVTLWANQEARELGPHDFGSMPPFQNHSFRLNEPDSEFLALITPGGFEPFYLNVSAPWSNPSDAPFPPDRPFPPPETENAQGAIFDYYPVDYALNNHLQNGTTNDSLHWHDGNNTLPHSAVNPYYIASNWGPKYLHRSLGQVIAPITTPDQSGNGNYSMSISTVVTRRRRAGEISAGHVFDRPQVFVVLEGLLSIEMLGQCVRMSTGDVAFVPTGTAFRYWSEVAFTKFYLGSNGKALGAKLIEEGEEWAYAIFPSYLG